MPALPPCWRGDYREEHPEGESFQSQLYCRHWQEWINPSGFTCKLCAAQAWPEIENYRVHVLPTIMEADGDDAAQEALVTAVGRGMLTAKEGLTLAQEFFGTD